jgi:hypothetical protein
MNEAKIKKIKVHLNNSPDCVPLMDIWICKGLQCSSILGKLPFFRILFDYCVLQEILGISITASSTNSYYNSFVKTYFEAEQLSGSPRT